MACSYSTQEASHGELTYPIFARVQSKTNSTSRKSTAAMVIPESCPACGSTRYKKNGHTRHGKQHHLCKNCERQFSTGTANHLIAAERRAELEHLLRERISLRGICRAVGVSLSWLLHLMVECFASCPDHLYVRPSASPANVLMYKRAAEADAMWSFVQKKANKPWIWLAT